MNAIMEFSHTAPVEKPMDTHRLHPPLLIPALLLAAGLANAGDIYHWVDDEGVAHYSQFPPPEESGVEVETRSLEASTPEDYDPVEDEYSVLNQAGRIHAEWRAIAEAREAREERRAAEREERRRRMDDERRPPDDYGWRYGRSVFYPSLLPHRPPWRPGHRVRRYQSEQLDEAGLWSEPPAYSINSTRHRQRVEARTPRGARASPMHSTGMPASSSGARSASSGIRKLA